MVKFEDSLGTAVWRALKTFLLCEDSAAASKSFSMCHFCKRAIRKDNMPLRCVLNGLKSSTLVHGKQQNKHVSLASTT